MTATLSQVAASCFLLSRPNIARPRIDPNDPPSITTQTQWHCAYFNFAKSALPPAVGTDYFNCGFVARPDGDWLMVRRSRPSRHCPFGVNDIVAFKLIDGTMPTEAKSLTIRAFYSDEHFEDPRAIYHNGRTLVSCTNFIWAPRGSGAHQIICEFDDNWNLVKRHDPIYGGNGQHCYGNKRQEKNWLWFIHDDSPHLIYNATPHDVCRFAWDFKSVMRYQTNPNIHWQWGQIRGGTPPVLHGDEYWTFYHSSVDWMQGGGRRYYVGAYAFDNKPPFKITRYTPQPLLHGSVHDVWAQGKPACLFPCGSILRHNEWLVSMGVNDLACAYACIPHDDLVKLTTAI